MPRPRHRSKQSRIFPLLLATVTLCGCQSESTENDPVVAGQPEQSEGRSPDDSASPLGNHAGPPPRPKTDDTDSSKPPSRSGAKAKKSNGPPAGSRRSTPGPQVLSPAERKVVELAERVGGTAERLPGGGGPPGPVGLVELPGDKGRDEDLRVIADLPVIYRLHLHAPGFTDRGLGIVAEVDKLVSMKLTGPTFSDEGLKHLAGHPSLRILILEGISLEGDGLEALQDNQQLECVDLVDIEMTPPILKAIEGFKFLRELRLLGTGISSTDVKHLEDFLPDCHVVVQAGDSS